MWPFNGKRGKIKDRKRQGGEVTGRPTRRQRHQQHVTTAIVAKNTKRRAGDIIAGWLWRRRNR